MVKFYNLGNPEIINLKNLAESMVVFELGIRVLGIGKGDEVITTPRTTFATPLSILRTGAITTNCRELAEKARSLKNYGQKKHYEHLFTGLNSRMDELQASFLREKIK